MKLASRPWLARYARPRDAAGRFRRGVVLWTRRDGQSRWIELPLREDDTEWLHHLARIEALRTATETA